MTSAAELLTLAAQRLKTAGIETPDFDARLLLAHVLEVPAAGVRFYSAPLCKQQIQTFQTLVDRRAQRCPVDKIIGRRGFYKYDFRVSPAVLTPRPDTEILVEQALDWIAQHNSRTVLDLGTGSGCIILSLLADCPNLSGTAIDISAPALEIARNNAYDLNALSRLKLLQASWADDLPALLNNQKFDLIVSNPPYIPDAEIQSLEPEVKDYDPLTALAGGKDGLRDYRRIASLAPALLADGGAVFLEVGENQAADVASIFEAAGLNLLEIAPDLSGTERCVILKK